MKKIDGKVFLSTYEVAKLLSVSPVTVQRWAKRSDSPARKHLRCLVDPLNGRTLFEKSSVDRVRSAYTKLIG